VLCELLTEESVIPAILINLLQFCGRRRLKTAPKIILPSGSADPADGQDTWEAMSPLRMTGTKLMSLNGMVLQKKYILVCFTPQSGHSCCVSVSYKGLDRGHANDVKS